MKTTWRKELTSVMRLNSESLDDVVANTMTDDDMDKEFDRGFGGTEGCEFTAWTANRVYFPICYDGAEWVGSVSRNPDGVPTAHQGG